MTKIRMKPHGPAWTRAANEMARDYCPTIYPCKKCEQPVIKGYCCTFCGTDEPR